VLSDPALGDAAQVDARAGRKEDQPLPLITLDILPAVTAGCAVAL